MIIIISSSYTFVLGISPFKEAYYKSFIGKSLEVLLESDGGYSKEYLKVMCSGEEGQIKIVTPCAYDNEKQCLICGE